MKRSVDDLISRSKRTNLMGQQHLASYKRAKASDSQAIRNLDVISNSAATGDYQKQPRRRDAEIKRHMAKYGRVK